MYSMTKGLAKQNPLAVGLISLFSYWYAKAVQNIGFLFKETKHQDMQLLSGSYMY